MLLFQETLYLSFVFEYLYMLAMTIHSLIATEINPTNFF